jgi:hypothetical protein
MISLGYIINILPEIHANVKTVCGANVKIQFSEANRV